MRKSHYYLILLTVANLLFSCKKNDENIVQSVNKKTITQSKEKQINSIDVGKEKTEHSSSNARKTFGSSNQNTLAYYLYLTSPNRDIPDNYVRPASNFSNTATICCNGICGIPGGTTSSSSTSSFPNSNTTSTNSPVTTTSTSTQNSSFGNIIAGTSCIPVFDPNGIPITFKASYGPDPRQIYYVYLPSATYNGKIVILIHGGGWVGGPDPTKVDGWASDYSTDPNTNLVINLRAEGFVVIAMLYRLVKYGNDDNEIAANDIGFQEQINDIDACVTHVHDNFPSCLNITTNNIQVFGESAGAHLALMFAYTKANTSYVKSVVSAAGPTNLAQFAGNIQVPPTAHTFTCGGAFNVSNPIPSGSTSHNPFYLPTTATDPNDANVVASVSPLNCNVSNSTDPNTRIMNSYRLAQSGVKQVVANPTATGSPFITFSPCNALVNTRIVPTFIIHGTEDWVVPYTLATSTMDTRLTAVGGLIGTYSSSNILQWGLPTTYPVAGKVHLIKKYVGGNHGVGNTDFQVRPNIITWLKGH